MTYSLLGDRIPLVADDDAEGTVLLVLVVQLQPPGDVVEGFPAAHVVDQQAEVGVLQVAGDEAFEALLAGSVPHLQAIAAVVIGEVLDEKVYADGCLCAGGRTL